MLEQSWEHTVIQIPCGREEQKNKNSRSIISCWSSLKGRERKRWREGMRWVWRQRMMVFGNRGGLVYVCDHGRLVEQSSGCAGVREPIVPHIESLLRSAVSTALITFPMKPGLLISRLSRLIHAVHYSGLTLLKSFLITSCQPEFPMTVLFHNRWGEKITLIFSIAEFIFKDNL